MRANYLIEVWKDFDEEFILQLLAISFRRQGFDVQNLHEEDRPHESGIDLLCEKDQEVIAIQAKVKPRKGDTSQFDCFAENTVGKTAIYVHIKNPTRSFMTHVERLDHDVVFWDVSHLHEALVKNEVTEYLCLIFSRHPLVLALTEVHELVSRNRRANYVAHELSSGELATLWSAKDNSVKAWVSLYLIHQKWNRTLMPITTIDREKFEEILQSVFNDLDVAYNLCGQRLISSFNDLAQRYPNILGLFWELVSHRTHWSIYTTTVEAAQSAQEATFFTHYSWVCPVQDDYCVFSASMRGFYSTINYFLENLKEIAKNVEDALDWTFSNMLRS